MMKFAFTYDDLRQKEAAPWSPMAKAVARSAVGGAVGAGAGYTANRDRGIMGTGFGANPMHGAFGAITGGALGALGGYHAPKLTKFLPNRGFAKHTTAGLSSPPTARLFGDVNPQLAQQTMPLDGGHMIAPLDYTKLRQAQAPASMGGQVPLPAPAAPKSKDQLKDMRRKARGGQAPAPQAPAPQAPAPQAPARKPQIQGGRAPQSASVAQNPYMESSGGMLHPGGYDPELAMSPELLWRAYMGK